MKHLTNRSNRSRRIVLSLALGMSLILGTAVPTFASGATGGSCGYTTTAQFVGTYCSGATYYGTPKILI